MTCWKIGSLASSSLSDWSSILARDSFRNYSLLNWTPSLWVIDKFHWVYSIHSSEPELLSSSKKCMVPLGKGSVIGLGINFSWITIASTSTMGVRIDVVTCSLFKGKPVVSLLNRLWLWFTSKTFVSTTLPTVWTGTFRGYLVGFPFLVVGFETMLCFLLQLISKCPKHLKKLQ